MPVSVSGPVSDGPTIARALELFMPPGQVVEMRILHTRKKTVSGYYDDPRALQRDAEKWSGMAPAVYITANPVNPDLAARAYNRCKEYAEATTGDLDIVSRRWFLVDLDAVRPSGISASQAEHSKALERSRQCIEYLRALGWPDPIEADSGNGGHLDYPIDMPNDNDTRDLLETCLKALGKKFDSDGVKVDQTVFNASRIWKLYGTMVCKGDDMPARPHRMARILSAPDELQTVTREQLEALAATFETKKEGNASMGASYSSFDLQEWIGRSGLDVASHGQWKDGYRWILRVCPWNSEHTNRAAFILRMASGAPAAGCHHDSCKGNDWHALRDLVEPGWRDCSEPNSPAKSYSEGRIISRNGSTVDTVEKSGSEYSEYSESTEVTNKLSNSGNSEYSEYFVLSINEIPDWFEPVQLRKLRLPEFPVFALPAWLANFVEAEAEATQTPADLSGMLVLSAVAVACARKIRVKIRDGWHEPTNIFTVVTLPPGARKSSVFRDVVDPIEVFEQQLAEEAGPEMAALAADRKVLEARLKKAEAILAKSSLDLDGPERDEIRNIAAELAKLPEPVIPRLLADDTSAEKLCSMLVAQQGRMAVLSPEAGIFGLMAGRYSKNSEPNFEVFLRGHSGDTLRVDRINRASEYVRDPALTMGLAVQPEAIRGLVDKPGFRGRGLLGRFLYSIPKDIVGSRRINAAPMSGAVRNAYDLHLQAILAMPFEPDEGPHIVAFSPPAQALLLEFEAWIEPHLKTHGALGPIQDWAAKLVGATGRISGLLHIASHSSRADPWGPEISAQTVEQAIVIAHYLIPHAQAAFGDMGDDVEVVNASKVLDWLRRSKERGFTKRDVWMENRARFPRPDLLDEPLAILCEHGYLWKAPPQPRTNAGRPPSPYYLVNPLWKR